LFADWPAQRGNLLQNDLPAENNIKKKKCFPTSNNEKKREMETQGEDTFPQL
jgi:hypothetical protein